jgi:hypothetical protein
MTKLAMLGSPIRHMLLGMACGRGESTVAGSSELRDIIGRLRSVPQGEIKLIANATL